MILIIGFLLFCGIVGADLPSLLTVEQDETSNYSTIAIYSWDSTGIFTREPLFTVTTLVTSAAFSKKTQTLFIFFRNNYDYIGIYDIKQRNNTNYIILDNLTNAPVLGSIYLDDKDELWIWFTDPDLTASAWFTSLELYNCVADHCPTSYLYRMVPLDPVVLQEYTIARQLVYFSDENRGSFWSWNFDVQQLLIDNHGIGTSPAFNLTDGLIYSLWYEDPVSVSLRSFDPRTKTYIPYGNIFPKYALGMRDCLAAFIDDYYITTIQSDNLLLVFAPPGGDNIYQVVDTKVLWFWEWQDSLVNGNVLH